MAHFHDVNVMFGLAEWFKLSINMFAENIKSIIPRSNFIIFKCFFKFII